MSPLWLIAAPGDPSPDQTWSSLEHKLTRESSLATVSRFSLPAALRCGTLDSLMSLSDDLVRQDGAAAAIVAKIERQLNDLQGKKERPLVNGSTLPWRRPTMCRAAWRRRFSFARAPRGRAVRGGPRRLTDRD